MDPPPLKLDKNEVKPPLKNDNLGPIMDPFMDICRQCHHDPPKCEEKALTPPPKNSRIALSPP